MSSRKSSRVSTTANRTAPLIVPRRTVILFRRERGSGRNQRMHVGSSGGEKLDDFPGLVRSSRGKVDHPHAAE